jgi:hypothetical protein
VLGDEAETIGGGGGDGVRMMSAAAAVMGAAAFTLLLPNGTWRSCISADEGWARDTDAGLSGHDG